MSMGTRVLWVRFLTVIDPKRGWFGKILTRSDEYISQGFWRLLHVFLVILLESNMTIRLCFIVHVNNIMLYIKKLLNFAQCLVSNEDRFVHQGCWLLSFDFDHLSHKDHVLASNDVCLRQSNNTARKHRGKVHKSANKFYMALHHYKLSRRSLYFDNSMIHASLSQYFHHLVDKQSNRLCWI